MVQHNRAYEHLNQIRYYVARVAGSHRHMPLLHRIYQRSPHIQHGINSCQNELVAIILNPGLIIAAGEDCALLGCYNG